MANVVQNIRQQVTGRHVAREPVPLGLVYWRFNSPILAREFCLRRPVVVGVHPVQAPTRTGQRRRFDTCLCWPESEGFYWTWNADRLYRCISIQNP